MAERQESFAAEELLSERETEELNTLFMKYDGDHNGETNKEESSYINETTVQISILLTTFGNISDSNKWDKN